MICSFCDPFGGAKRQLLKANLCRMYGQGGNGTEGSSLGYNGLLLSHCCRGLAVQLELTLSLMWSTTRPTWYDQHHDELSLSFVFQGNLKRWKIAQVSIALCLQTQDAERINSSTLPSSGFLCSPFS